MATHASAVKRARQNEKRRVRNRTAASKVNTLVKGVFNAKDKAEAEAKLKDAVSALDKAAVKGRLHKNNVARKKAKITNHVNKLS